MRGLDKSPSLWFDALLAALVCGAVLTSTVRAQTPAPAPDFGQGFELLRQAGLPDVKDWKYVRLESDYLPGSEMGIEAVLAAKQTGNAWLEPKSGSSKLQRILIDGSRLMAASPDSDGREDYAANTQAAEAMGLQFVPGKVKEVSFASGDAKQNSEAADAEKLATGITKLAADEEGKERLMQYRGQIVSVFFTAAHYHRRGYVKESAQIVTALQQMLPRPEALIELSVESLGDLRLEQCVARFRTDRDWKTLQSSLESVMADFPELWTSRPLAERLLAQVKMRSAGQAPPLISGGSFPLTDEQKEWWNKVTSAAPAEKKGDDEEAMMGMQSPGSEQWAQAWLVKRMEIPADLNRYWGSVEGESLAPFDPSRDWDWITVMAAALGDNTLTMNFSSNRQGMFDSTWSSFDPEEAPSEPSEMELDQRWEQLGAPLTRDDMARAFLGTVLPLPDEYSGPDGAKRMSVEDLRESAKSWSAKTTGKKGLELTRLYFKEGSEMHRRIMASVLARTGDEKDFALLEEVALSSPQNNLELAMQILQKRKVAGKPFLEKFKTRLMEEVKENSPSEEVPDYIKGQLTALDGLVSGKGMKELLADYADKKMDERAFMQSVHSLQEGYEWKQEDIEAVFGVMAKIPASEGRRRFMLLEMTSRALMTMFKVDVDGSASPGTDAGSTAEEKSGETPPPDWVVKLLKQFIEQNREVKVSGWVGSDIRLSQYGCFLLDSLWKSGAVTQNREIFQQLPQEDAWSYIEARGMARLEGRQPPPLPDPARVPDARKAEIKAAAQKIKEGEWANFYATLSLDEKLAVTEAFSGMEPDESWRKPLLTVTEVKLDAQDATATALKPESWMAMKGRVLDGAVVKQLLELCQQSYKDGGKSVTGMVNALSHYRGMGVTVGVANDDEFRRSDVSSWITTVSDEDAASALSAIAYVRWRERSGSTGAMMAVRGKDGAWKMHTGDEPPPGFADLPFNPLLDADAFEKGFNDYLTGWSPKQQMWNLDFGVYKVPVEAGAKE